MVQFFGSTIGAHWAAQPVAHDPQPKSRSVVLVPHDDPRISKFGGVVGPSVIAGGLDAGV